MRRHATMVMALVLPLAISMVANAQTGAQPKAVAASAPSAAPSATAVASAATAGSAAPAAASAAPAGAASASPSAPPEPKLDGSSYAIRLRDLEARVDDLKDQIRRSHTRLSLLSDTIMTGGAAGSRAEVVLQNEMSSAFKLIRAVVLIDNAVQFNRQDETGALGEQKELPIYSGSVPPGDHSVKVLLNFQGNGFGVFTYLRGYKFEVKSSHSFTAVEGKSLALTAIALEKGGVTTPLEQRPQVEWREKLQPLTTGGPVSNAAPGGSAPAATAPQVSGGGSVSVGGKQ